MAIRLPLVLINGQLCQLPTGDSISGAIAAVALSQVEVDFGTIPVAGKTFSLTDATVLPTSKISVWQSGDAATGRQADENEMDQLSMVAGATGIGTFYIYAAGIIGPVSGKFKINYLVG